jgi:hypothetical protein
MMKQFLTLTALFISWGVFAQNRVGFVTAPTTGGTERFHNMLRLSDSTILVGGDAANMNWVPSTVTPVVLNTSNVTITSTSTGVAFIAHFNKDFSALLNVVQFPANTVLNVYKIKTNTAPNLPTGDLYISGEREGLSSSGYYIAKLNNNFVNGVPSSVEWFFAVNAGNVNNGKGIFEGKSWHRDKQPWDVDNQGNIYYGQREEYSFNWASINKLNPNGTVGAVKGWTNHTIVYSWNAAGDTTYTDTTNNTIRNARTSYIGTRKNEGDSIFVRMQYGSGTVTRKVKIVRFVESFIGMKHAGTTVRPLNSLSMTDYNFVGEDENGFPRRGAMPDDYLYSGPVVLNTDSVYTFNTNQTPGFFGDYAWNGQLHTSRVGDIVVDKRNNDVYIGYTTTQRNGKEIYNNSNGFGSVDFNSTIVAMKQDGTMKWWARMHPSDTTGTSYSANTLIDYLAIDYANSDLIALASGYGISTSNLWKGNENIADPGGMKFKNNIPDDMTQKVYTWIGRYDLDTLKIRNSTFVSEFGAKVAGGVPLTDPNLDGWLNPNTVTAANSYENTRGHGLYVDGTGHIYIIGEANRTITTANAYQKMYKADLDNCIDSSSSSAYFVRKYTPNLSNIVYSSLLTTQWSAVTGQGGNGIRLTGILGDERAIYTTGVHLGQIFFGSVPTVNVPSFGSNTFQGVSAVFARLAYDCPVPAEPMKITLEGRNTHPNNTSQNYSIPTVANATGYSWAITGTGWSITSGANTSAAQINLSSGANNVPSSVVSASVSNSCGTSLPRATRFYARPVLSSTGLNLSVSGSALLAVNGSSFSWLKDEVVVGTGTSTSFNATSFGNGTYKVVVTNNCVSDTSNAVFVTSLAPKQIAQQVKVYPNPNSGQFVVETGNSFTEKVILVITDLYGKVVLQKELSHWQSGEQLPINLNSQAAGTYWISLQTQEGKIVKPFVKQ